MVAIVTVATALPVICTDIVGLRDAIVDGVIGILVPPKKRQRVIRGHRKSAAG